MRIIPYTILTLTFYACSSPTEIEHISNKVDSMQYQFKLEKQQFMDRPMIKDQHIQDSLFAQFSGIWEYVYVVNHTEEKTIAKNTSVLYRDGISWSLDYPCSWAYKDHSEEVYLTADSIFFTKTGYDYLDEKRYEFKGDSLMLYGANPWSEYTEYYIRTEYDTTVLNELEVLGFNKTCITGTWHLTQISDNKLETYLFDSTNFENIPRTIDFATYKFEGNLLISLSNPADSFRVEQFVSYLDKCGYLMLVDATNPDDPCSYMYQPD